ncbi:MAG: DUF433 domain-containing protein [Tepidisphaeraceae bacterium]
MAEIKITDRITANPEIYGGKPIIRGHRLAVEHVLMMMAAGDTIDTLVEEYDWLEREDVLACLDYAARVIRRERFDTMPADAMA